MTKIRVEYFTGISAITRRGFEDVELRQPTLGSLLEYLVDMHGQPLARVLLDEKIGGMNRHVAAAINGHETRDLEAGLRDGDVVFLFPPITGGDSTKLRP